MKSEAEPLLEHGPFREGAIPAVTPGELMTWFGLEDDFSRIADDNERRADGAAVWRAVADKDARRRLQAFQRRTGATPVRVATIGTRVDLLCLACGADPSPSDDRAATIAAHDLNARVIEIRASHDENARDERMLPLVSVIATFPFTLSPERCPPSTPFAARVPRGEVAAFRQALLDVARTVAVEG